MPNPQKANVEDMAPLTNPIANQRRSSFATNLAAELTLQTDPDNEKPASTAKGSHANSRYVVTHTSSSHIAHSHQNHHGGGVRQMLKLLKTTFHVEVS